MFVVVVVVVVVISGGCSGVLIIVITNNFLNTDFVYIIKLSNITLDSCIIAMFVNTK